jgi:hypothetical protein
MWQKERLLNIALKALPSDCDKLVWLDADIIFHNDNWIGESCSLLEEYRVVQPFEYVVKLPKVVSASEKSHLWGNAKAGRISGKAYKMSRAETASDNRVYGHPGMVWAARRNWLEKVGFYDKMVLGSGDYLMSSALYHDRVPLSRHFPGELIDDARRWNRKVYDLVRASVYYTPGTIYHLWHGDRSLRLLDCRMHVLDKHKFGTEDICLNADECWEWATPKPKLHRWTEEYFRRRNEEGGSLSTAAATMHKFREFGGFLLIKKLRRYQSRGVSLLKTHVPSVYDFLKQFKS